MRFPGYLKLLAALVWLLVMVLLSVATVINKPVPDTNMMSLLPTAEQQPLVKAAADQMGRNFSQSLLILVTAEDKQQRQQVVQQLQQTFSRLPEVSSVLAVVDNTALQAQQKKLAPYRYILLTDQQRQRLMDGDSGQLTQKAVAKIINPLSSGQLDLVKDPFALQLDWQRQSQPDWAVALEEGYLKVSALKDTYLLVLNLKADAFLMQTQQSIMRHFQQVNAALPETVTLSASGLLIHAAAGAEQAQKEISTIGLGSMLGIILLMCWVFRSLKTVALLLLPVLVGCIVATAVTFLWFERVHIVTFAFGAGLIGVAVDYALHYLCERQTRTQVLSKIFPGLLLGLISSILAYAALAIAPFPGLRQMAVFSVSGLLAAWLTVVLWLPFLSRQQTQISSSILPGLTAMLAKMPTLQQNNGLKYGMLSLVLLALFVVAQGKAEDDIRLLQTSPEALIAEDERVQNALGLSSGTKFILLPCPAIQQCLQKEEQLRPDLQRLVDEGRIDGYQMLSQRLPSLARQDDNAGLTQTLYQTQLKALFTMVGLPSELAEKAQQALHQGLDNRLTLDVFNEQLAIAAGQSRWLETADHGAATMISIKSQQPWTLASLGLTEQQTPSLVVVDQVETISGLLETYRQQIMLWMMLAYLLVFGILLYRYRLAAWRIILPPLLGSLFTFAVLLSMLPGINLFHVMALILVLGIGLDMGIFLTEAKQAVQTWLAVSLSVMTSLLAFGLLALSNTPVLQHFGLTVLLGLSFVWILAVLVRPTIKEG